MMMYIFVLHLGELNCALLVMANPSCKDGEKKANECHCFLPTDYCCVIEVHVT